MVDSTSDNQALVSNNFSDEAVKIDEQSGLDKSPMEQVWEALAGTDAIYEQGNSDGSREIDTEISDAKALDKSPIEQVWEAVLTGIDAIDERGTRGGFREVDNEITDAKAQDRTVDTLKDIMESGMETAQEKIQEATNPEGSDIVDNSEISNIKDQSSDAEME
jgi:hypothetical protein